MRKGSDSMSNKSTHIKKQNQKKFQNQSTKSKKKEFSVTGGGERFSEKNPMAMVNYLFDRIHNKNAKDTLAKDMLKRIFKKPETSRDRPLDVITYVDKEKIDLGFDEYQATVFKCPKCEDHMINRNAICCDQCAQMFTDKHLKLTKKMKKEIK